MDAIEQAKSDAAPAPAPRKLLKLVKVKDPVCFAGPADMTLLAKDGDLEIDTELRVILCQPNDPRRDPCVVPLENVVFVVPLDAGAARKLADAKNEREAAIAEKAAAKQAEQKAAKLVLPPGVRLPKPKGDTVKFVRGPDGKPVEVIE